MLKKHLLVALLGSSLLLQDAYSPLPIYGQEEITFFDNVDENGAILSHSGSLDRKQLSQEEISKLLKENPLTLPENVFEVEPSIQAPYSAGKVKLEALQATLNRLNAVRTIAGLPLVELDPEWCDEAQYGAVLVSAAGLDHHPTKPADMDEAFYNKGYAATSTSNLSNGGTLTSMVDSCIDDSDASNLINVGHRRWLLNPRMNTVGFGYTPKGVSQKVIGNQTERCDYNFISWPSSGNFPNTFMKNIRGHTVAWSISLNPNKYQAPTFSSVTITLTRQSDGHSWNFTSKGGTSFYDGGNKGAYFNVSNNNYGVNNCIIFRPDNISDYEGVYSVTINGLKTKDGEGASLSYEVDFFNPIPTDVYRIYNTKTGEHFYTRNDSERKEMLKNPLWKDEDKGWVAPYTSNYPVYRLSNPNTTDHHYTLDKNEYDTLQSLGWIGEGIVFYSADQSNPQNVLLYRLYNPQGGKIGSHHYTANQNEREELLKQGWKDEGVAWAAYPDDWTQDNPAWNIYTNSWTWTEWDFFF